jgi:hypothetical protein
MCKAFSCLVLPNKKVIWKFAKDSHEDLIQIAKLKDDTLDPSRMTFARCEISPANNNYLKPDEWKFHLDESIKPAWFTQDHEKACNGAWTNWKKHLDKILIYKEIINPFKIVPPTEITQNHLKLLKQWDSVRDSVWASVRASVRDSVWASVRASVRDSVWASVRASVEGYMGSFFKLPRKNWEYTEKIKTKGYPFQPAIDLWEMGLVPSFDGKIWRLHGGEKAKILWEGQV